MSTRSVPSLEGLFARAPFVADGRPRPAVQRLVLMIVVLGLVLALAGGLRTAAGDNPVLALLAGAVTVVGALKIYAAAVRGTERRDVHELDRAAAPAGLRRGTLYGLVLFCVTIALIALCGGYAMHGYGSFGGTLALLGVMAGAAVTEELLFRGVVFRIVEELAGTRGALIASSLLFGGLHLVNPGATAWGALAIAVEAGLMLGAAYAATRTLWLPIGLHFAWNFAESALFGTTVSGSGGGPTGLVHGVVSGPAILSGGDFGPEASVFSLLVCTVATVLFLRTAKRRGRLYGRGGATTAAEVS
ncbi:type II CAAX prenyl endopeptidase Rce1 family protein [Streptomyces sp. NPDC008150]|uniref:CPBP family intramembrane glutamic endopeptidase n=1 Tax=Streptomyces sp. NPDC008150 TaxID=3364816 RepID=UPI0036EEAA1A